MKQRLADFGIDTIADLVAMPADQLDAIKNMPAKEGGIPGIQKYRDLCDNVLDEDCPLDEDYRMAENPYLARYGEEEWEAKLKTCTHMSLYVSIADMITHIYD
jgi:hypothetical protein